MKLVISKNKVNDDVADKKIDGQRNCEDSGCEEVIEEEGDNYIENNNILLFTFNLLFREIFLKRTFFSIKSFLFIGFTAVVRILNKQSFSKILQLTIIQYEVAKG